MAEFSPPVADESEKNKKLEELKELQDTEWKIDVSTIGAVYQRAAQTLVYLNGIGPRGQGAVEQPRPLVAEGLDCAGVSDYQERLPCHGYIKS